MGQKWAFAPITLFVILMMAMPVGSAPLTDDELESFLVFAKERERQLFPRLSPYNINLRIDSMRRRIKVFWPTLNSEEWTKIGTSMFQRELLDGISSEHVKTLGLSRHMIYAAGGEELVVRRNFGSDPDVKIRYDEVFHDSMLQYEWFKQRNAGGVVNLKEPGFMPMFPSRAAIAEQDYLRKHKEWRRRKAFIENDERMRHEKVPMEPRKLSAEEIWMSGIDTLFRAQDQTGVDVHKSREWDVLRKHANGLRDWLVIFTESLEHRLNSLSAEDRRRAFHRIKTRYCTTRKGLYLGSIERSPIELASAVIAQYNAVEGRFSHPKLAMPPKVKRYFGNCLSTEWQDHETVQVTTAGQPAGQRGPQRYEPGCDRRLNPHLASLMETADALQTNNSLWVFAILKEEIPDLRDLIAFDRMCEPDRTYERYSSVWDCSSDLYRTRGIQAVTGNSEKCLRIHERLCTDPQGSMDGYLNMPLEYKNYRLWKSDRERRRGLPPRHELEQTGIDEFQKIQESFGRDR